jgi:hypothetical protein
MFFIVSTGRSGTQTIARTLSLLPGCVCLHEPSPELILESSQYRYGKIDQIELSNLLRESRQRTVNGCVYCEANQTLSLIIPVLTDVFPEARYIWLIRNGLDVVASAYQKQWYTGHSENHDRYEDCSQLEKAWIDGRIQGDLCGDLNADDWRKLDRFGRCCWYWSYVNRVIDADLHKYSPDRFLMLRIEDIDKDFESIVDWMGLKDEVVPSVGRYNISKRVPYHWTEWSAEERKTFDYWCGDLMGRFYPRWRTCFDKDFELFVTSAFKNIKQKREIALEQVKLKDGQLKEQSDLLQQYREQLKRQHRQIKEQSERLQQLREGQRRRIEQLKVKDGQLKEQSDLLQQYREQLKR